MPSSVHEYREYRIAIYSPLWHYAVVTPAGSNRVIEFGNDEPTSSVDEGPDVCLTRARARSSTNLSRPRSTTELNSSPLTPPSNGRIGRVHGQPYRNPQALSGMLNLLTELSTRQTLSAHLRHHRRAHVCHPRHRATTIDDRLQGHKWLLVRHGRGCPDHSVQIARPSRSSLQTLWDILQ